MNQEELNEQLKPCPFCGGKEILVDLGCRMWIGTHYGEPLAYELIHWCDNTRFTNRVTRKAKTLEEAIDLWNQRI